MENNQIVQADHRAPKQIVAAMCIKNCLKIKSSQKETKILAKIIKTQ